MRLTPLLLIAAAAEAAVIKGRQLGSFGRLKVVDTKKLTPVVKPNAVHVIQYLGPITLKGRGSGQDSGQQNFMYSVDQKVFCRNCTVLKGHIGLADMSKTPIVPQANSGVYIHHILTFDTSKKSSAFVSCGGLGGGSVTGGLGSKFIGSGEDNNNVEVWYTRKDGSHNGGFHIKPSDGFSMNVDLVSLNTGSSQIYLAVDIEYLPGVVGADTKETLLTVESCGGQKPKASTTGPTSSTSAKYTFKESGTIIVAKGHLHAGGDLMRLSINGKVVCESKASYGGKKGPQAIDEMSLCEPIKVKVGDTMTFAALYDASKHPVRHESHGMGAGMPDIMGMFDIVFSSS